MHFLLSATLNINMSLKYINEKKMIITSIFIYGIAHFWWPDLYKKLHSIITCIDAIFEIFWIQLRELRTTYPSSNGWVSLSNGHKISQHGFSFYHSKSYIRCLNPFLQLKIFPINLTLNFEVNYTKFFRNNFVECHVKLPQVWGRAFLLLVFLESRKHRFHHLQ